MLWLWTTGRLGSGQLDSGRLDARTLEFGCLDAWITDELLIITRLQPRRYCNWKLWYWNLFKKICICTCSLIIQKRTFNGWRTATVVAKLIFQKQPSRGVLRKRYSENMQQIYRRTPMPMCDLNKVALQYFIEITLRHGYSPVNFLIIFRTPFPKNTSWWLLLTFERGDDYNCSLKKKTPK